MAIRPKGLAKIKGAGKHKVPTVRESVQVQGVSPAVSSTIAEPVHTASAPYHRWGHYCCQRAEVRQQFYNLSLFLLSDEFCLYIWCLCGGWIQSTGVLNHLRWQLCWFRWSYQYWQLSTEGHMSSMSAISQAHRASYQENMLLLLHFSK